MTLSGRATNETLKAATNAEQAKNMGQVTQFKCFLKMYYQRDLLISPWKTSAFECHEDIDEAKVVLNLYYRKVERCKQENK